MHHILILLHVNFLVTSYITIIIFKLCKSIIFICSKIIHQMTCVFIFFYLEPRWLTTLWKCFELTAIVLNLGVFFKKRQKAIQRLPIVRAKCPAKNHGVFTDRFQS